MFAVSLHPSLNLINQGWFVLFWVFFFAGKLKGEINNDDVAAGGLGGNLRVVF